MSTAYVRVAPDSTGKLVQTFENSVGGNTVEAQAVVITDTAGIAITTLPIQAARSATATTTQIADSATSQAFLLSNVNRLGATIQNDSSGILYLKLGTTATTIDYTVRLIQYAYYEVPYGYTGRIDGIWATDPSDGGARITELT